MTGNIITNSSTNIVNWGFGDAGSIRISFTVDVNVVDETGTAINGATVAITPTGTSENNNNFSVTTDANGDITQQTLTTRIYTSSNPGGTTTTTTITNYNPFTLTVSKAGYKTYQIKNWTIDYTKYALKGIGLKITLPNNASAANINLVPEMIEI